MGLEYTNEYTSKDLSHHGIVSVVCDEIGLVEIIDQCIPPDIRTQISVGECVKLMIINGLGFSSRPLYLESQFFENKPVERFLGRPIEAGQINDDRLGRCLDRCFEHGCDALFARIATRAAYHYQVDRKFRHLDTTSMSVDGDYAQEDGLGLVQFGYSKDRRSDLKQFMISLMSSQDGDVPLLAQTIAGNSSDKVHFREVLSSLKDQIDPSERAYYIMDSAFYGAENLQAVSDKISWITRVPETLSDAKKLMVSVDVETMEVIREGYRARELCSAYAGIKQRWLLVFSEAAKARELQSLERRIKKESQMKKQELKTLSRRLFGCRLDAESAIAAWIKGMKYHRCGAVTLSEKLVKADRGRPKKDEPLPVSYQVEVGLEPDKSAISRLTQAMGMFILASNELDTAHLSAQELLANYKGQQSVERGFRFLKDPLFLGSSVFLKKEERIVALSMIMCLCLLVYMLAQRLIRQRLQSEQATVQDQRGQPTKKPTMRWIFQIFEGIHLLLFIGNGGPETRVLNLTSQRHHILFLLGPPFQKIYQNSP